MTLKAAVLCEDHTYDQYILRPTIASVLASLGKSRARVQMVSNPRITGFDSLLANLCSVIHRYDPQVDLIVVAFDLDGEDGKQGRPDKHARVSNALAECNSPKVVLAGAVQELEVWALWGSRSALNSSWSDVRKERDPKERYFDRLLVRTDKLSADGGRSRLMNLSLSPNVYSLASGCNEVALLIEDIDHVINGSRE